MRYTMADRLKAMLPPPVAAIANNEDGAANPELMQAQQQIGQLQQQLQQLGAQLQQLEQDKSLQAREIDIKAYQAETDRMEALKQIQEQMVVPRFEPNYQPSF